MMIMVTVMVMVDDVDVLASVLLCVVGPVGCFDDIYSLHAFH